MTRDDVADAMIALVVIVILSVASGGIWQARTEIPVWFWVTGVLVTVLAFGSLFVRYRHKG